MDDEPVTASDYFHRGVDFLEKGEYQRALECVNAAIERNYFGADIALVKGEILFELERFDDALQWFQRAAELDDTLKTEALLWRGRVFMDMRQFGRALSAFNRVIELHPLPGMAYLHKGTVLVERGDFLKGLESLEEAHQLLGDSDERLAEVLYWQGRGLSGLNRIGEAIACFERCLALEPTFVEAYTDLGDLYRSTGRVEQTVEVYRRGLKQLPEDAVLCNELGNALRDLGRIDESLEMFKQALEAGEVESIAYFNRALTYERAQRWDEALKDYERVLEANPADIESRTRRLDIFSRLDQFTRAFDEYANLSEDAKALSETTQVYARFLNRFARAQEAKADTAGAMITYRALLGLHPDLLSLDNPGKEFASPRERQIAILKLLDGLADKDENSDLRETIAAPLLFSLRTTEDADSLADASEALAKRALDGPYPEVAQLVLAEIAYYHRHQPEVALEFTAAALARRPDYVAALWLKVSILLEGMNDAPGAIETYHEILRFSPDNPSVLDALGQLYLEQGEPLRALGCYRTLIASTPGDLAIQRELAQCYLALGRTSEAIDELRRLANRNEQDLELKLDIATALLRSNALNEAGELLSEIEDINGHLNPSVDDTCAELRAGLLNAQKRHDQALQALGDIPDDELSEDGLLQRGIALAASDDLDSASDDFLRVMSEGSPGHPTARRARVELAKIERAQGNVERAIELLQEGLAQFPYQVRVRSLLVWFMQEAAREEDAIREEEMLSRYRDLEVGRRLVFAEEFADAADEFRSLTRSYPNFPEAYYWLAAAQCRCGQFKASVASLAESLELDASLLARAKKDPLFEGFAFSELNPTPGTSS